MPEKRRFGGEIFPEQTAPATPGAGTVALYAKSDGKMYFKDDTGAEYTIAQTVRAVRSDTSAAVAIVASDSGKLVVVSNAAGVVVTLPADLAIGTTVDILSVTAGPVTFVAGAGAAIQLAGHLIAEVSHVNGTVRATCGVDFFGSELWYLEGDLVDNDTDLIAWMAL